LQQGLVSSPIQKTAPKRKLGGAAVPSRKRQKKEPATEDSDSSVGKIEDDKSNSSAEESEDAHPVQERTEKIQLRPRQMKPLHFHSD